VRLSLRARLLVIPAVVVIFAVTLLTVLESRSQRAWIIQREASGLTRLVHEAARPPRPNRGTGSRPWTRWTRGTGCASP
jgi:hypothetical protein